MAKKNNQKASPKQTRNLSAKMKRWFVGGCVWYAIISLIPLLINAALPTLREVPTKSFLCLFPFSFSMSGAGMLYRSKLPRWSRILGHYGISILSFLLFILLPAGTTGALPSGVYVLLMLVLLTVIYWILFAIVHIFAERWKRVLEED